MASEAAALQGLGADPGGLLAGDAALANLRVRLAGQHLDLLPDGVLVLEREDVAHLRTGVAIDHVGPPMGFEVGLHSDTCIIDSTSEKDAPPPMPKS